MLDFITPLVQNYGLIGVLVGTFLSYSILPLPSELAIMVASGFYNVYLVFIVAMLGSTLGGVFNFYLGVKGRSFLLEKQSKKFVWARKTFCEHGSWAILFLSWLPILGDPLIIVAGVFDMNFWKFLFYSTLAKIWYFWLLIFLGINLMGYFGF